MAKRVRFIKQNEIHEFFEEGRPHALRSQIIVNSKMKEMHFYSNARHDGLYKRVEDSRKVSIVHAYKPWLNISRLVYRVLYGTGR